MPITSSGQIALIADIAAEFTSLGSTDVSLDGARAEAGLTAGEVQMTDFYGLSDAVAPTVTTSAASSVGFTSMVANGNVTSDGGGTITQRGFYFGTSSSYSSNTKYSVSGTTGAYTRTFSGLSQGTTYYMTAYAINSAGESVGSTVSQATSFNFTFSNGPVNSSYNIYGGSRWKHYYSNPSGGVIFGANLANTWQCLAHCNNRLNYIYPNYAGNVYFYTNNSSDPSGAKNACSNDSFNGSASTFSSISGASNWTFYPSSPPNSNTGSWQATYGVNAANGPAISYNSI